MRALGQPAHNVFGADNGHGKAFRIAIESRADMQSVRLQKLATGREIGQRIGHMFDHLHVEHNIKRFACGGQRFGRGVTIVNLKARLFGVDTGDRKVAFGRIRPPNYFGPPSRAIGSLSKPPPQPMSRSRKPLKGCGFSRLRPNSSAICVVI